MSTPVWRITGKLALMHGSALDILPQMGGGQYDAIVTDPPYNLAFMGRAWDSHDSPKAFQAWCTQWATEAYRLLKPGGHLVAFGGTRTYHRLACAIEDAGFEIRDSLHWVYGSGFPKSLDVGKAIDKAAGAEREVTGTKLGQPGYSLAENTAGGRQAYGEFTDAEKECAVTAPATEDAARWDGWGTALKPAHEPIILARKPLEGTVVANVLAHGTGALNIDGCRAGRWPPNVIFTHGPACNGECAPGCPAAELDAQSGSRRAGSPVAELDAQSGSRRAGSPVAGTEPSARMGGSGIYGAADSTRPVFAGYQDQGGASRFFPCLAWEDSDFIPFRYQAKAPKSERPVIEIDGTPHRHPTVKPVALMRWLVRLVAAPVPGLPPPVILDPFAGTSPTGAAALAEGVRCVLIEQSDTDEAPYIRLSRARLGLDGDPVLR